MAKQTEKTRELKGANRVDDFVGVIIAESLEKNDILRNVKILKTTVEQVTENHKTPWIKQWTLHNVEIKEKEADDIAKDLSESLDSEHSWYADFKNDKFHYVIFRNNVFKVARSKTEQYNDVTKYGLTLGIPDYQLDFSPHIKACQIFVDIVKLLLYRFFFRMLVFQANLKTFFV